MDILKCNIKLGRYLNYGQKPYEKLSIRQKRRIICRIENNLSSKKSIIDEDSENTHQNISGNQFINNSFNHGHQSLFENILTDLSDDNNDSDDTDDSNDNQLNVHDHNDHVDDHVLHDHLHQSIDGETLKKILAECFVINNISLKQGDEILKVLRMRRCFSNLPKSCKTLIQTLCIPVDIIALEPGHIQNTFILISKSYFRHYFICTTY